MMKGMDISKWQGAVDFAKVAASGIQFAILREGYRQAVDGKFFEYVNGCRANNIPVKGVYQIRQGMKQHFVLHRLRKPDLARTQ